MAEFLMRVTSRREITVGMKGPPISRDATGDQRRDFLTTTASFVCLFVRFFFFPKSGTICNYVFYKSTRHTSDFPLPRNRPATHTGTTTAVALLTILKKKKERKKERKKDESSIL